MHCKICGTENQTVRYRNAQRQTLCSFCVKGMPAKMDREAFDNLYWNGRPQDEPEAIRREFYEDYLASHDTAVGYKNRTTYPA